MQIILDTHLLCRAFELWEEDRRDGNCGGCDESMTIEDFGSGQAGFLLDYYYTAEKEA